jgi:hypothetical protein
MTLAIGASFSLISKQKQINFSNHIILYSFHGDLVLRINLEIEKFKIFILYLFSRKKIDFFLFIRELIPGRNPTGIYIKKNHL